MNGPQGVTFWVAGEVSLLLLDGQTGGHRWRCGGPLGGAGGDGGRTAAALVSIFIFYFSLLFRKLDSRPSFHFHRLTLALCSLPSPPGTNQLYSTLFPPPAAIA